MGISPEFSTLAVLVHAVMGIVSLVFARRLLRTDRPAARTAEAS